MSLTFRNIKGSKLTSNEVDENFRTLNEKGVEYVVGEVLRSPGLRIFNEQVYMLKSSVSFPFTCVDFATELAAENWVAVGGSAESLRTGRYEHHVQNVLAASVGWYGYRYNAATATKWMPYFETGFWDGATLNNNFRGWSDVIEFDQEVTSVTVRQLRNTVETKVHIVYFEIVGSSCVNAQLIKEIVLPADASGLVKEIQEFSVVPFTMSKNGLITAFYFNNNLSDSISHLSIYVNYKEKI